MRNSLSRFYRTALALALVLALISPLAPSPAGSRAGAEGDKYRIIELETEAHRVKLRAKPSASAKVLGQYFSGVEMSVTSISKGWATVELGGAKGYMMSKYLERVAEESAYAPCGESGAARYPDEDGFTRIYDAPKEGAKELLTLERGAEVRVLGTAGDDWLHVRAGKENESGVYGYASSVQITQTSNFASAVVEADKATVMVNIRSAPKRSAKAIGKYFSGVEVSRLFDDHTADDGWDKVRVGDVVGYIMVDFLDNSSAGAPDFRAPLTEIKGDVQPIYPAPKKSESIGSLGKHDAFSVLGVFGNYYQVRIETPFEEQRYRYGFIKTGAVKKKPTKSAVTSGALKQDQPLYWLDESGKPYEIKEFSGKKGAKLRIYGALSSPDGVEQTVSEYIYPEAKWLYVDIQLDGENSSTDCYIPIEAVEYDEALNYPEAMTLG